MKYSQEQFIQKSQIKHNNKYFYSKSNYTGKRNKIIITCPKHGDFEQIAGNHLNGQGCKKCFLENKTLTTEKFIQKARRVHDNKYNYSKVNYILAIEKITIICPIHGEFEQTPDNHKRGSICPYCSIEKMKLTLNQFIQKAIAIHGNKYDYSKINYINSYTKIIIICPIHGEFEQKPSDHLIGRGCVKCFLDKKRLSTNQFIQKAIAIHGNKYDYSKINYINNRTKITIICPIHGEFEQKPNNHIQNKNGCSQCKSSKGELAIKAILEKYNIEIITQYKLPEIVANYEIDFYLPEYNLLIEFHGKQHYEYIPFFHHNGEDSFLAQKNRDDIVRYSAKQFGYRYLEFNYKQLKYLSSEQFEKLVINSIKDIKSSIFLSSLEDNHKIQR